MLGLGKKEAKTEDPAIWGWRKADLQFLEKHIRGDRPLVQLQITGFRQIFSIQGDGYASAIRRNRSDHEEYAKFALAFENVPGNEDELHLVEQKNELVGSLRFPAARVEGSFETADDPEEVKAGHVGAMSITGESGLADKPYSPLLQFHLLLQSPTQETTLRQTLQSALSVSTHAFLNLVLWKVPDPKAWIEGFSEDGYSASLPVRSAHFTTEIGKGPFE